MNKKVLGVLSILLVTLLVAQVSGSATAGQVSADADENAYGIRSFSGGGAIVIPAAAFVSDGTSPDSRFFPFGGGYFQGDASNYGCMEAPIYLPDGSVIEQVFASVYDYDAGRGIYVDVRRVDNFNGSTDILASMGTSTAGAFDGIEVISDVTIDNPIVVYPDYSYYVTTCLGSGSIRLYSVRVYAGYPIYLPIILQSY
jgi:hypothetical protein